MLWGIQANQHVTRWPVSTSREWNKIRNETLAFTFGRLSTVVIAKSAWERKHFLFKPPISTVNSHFVNSPIEKAPGGLTVTGCFACSTSFSRALFIVGAHWKVFTGVKTIFILFACFERFVPHPKFLVSNLPVLFFSSPWLVHQPINHCPWIISQAISQAIFPLIWRRSISQATFPLIWSSILPHPKNLLIRGKRLHYSLSMIFLNGAVL